MGIGKKEMAIEDPGNPKSNDRACQQRRKKADEPVLPKRRQAVRTFQCITYYKPGNNEKNCTPR
jgi:hypothetical protein